MSLRRPVTPARRAASATATARGAAGRGRGLGEGGEITVMGARANAIQRATIDACLREALDLGSARRLMVAVIMCITQESGAGLPAATHSTRTAGTPPVTHRGPFQQQPGYGTDEQILDPATSTRGFLLGRHGIPGWKQVHGGLKSAPGDLGAAIEAVQRSGNPALYNRWQAEATRTVDVWLGADRLGERTRVERYEFTRGERHGRREDSWETMERLAQEVSASRWAVGNVLSYASDEELRAGAPSVRIRGDEGWLLARPQWEWGAHRTIVQVTLSVAAERWSILPGGVVELARTLGPMQGVWIVASVSGQRLDSPVVSVVLRRPMRLRPEPAPQTQRTTTAASAAAASDVLTACRTVDHQNRPYLYGGGHGRAFAAITEHEGLDCSSSCSLALWMAGLFDGSQPITSGEFMTGWGTAGRGHDFTVRASAEHVWIEFHDGAGGEFSRFDTSPHGEGPSGPHLRRRARGDAAAFTSRHWPGR